MRQANRKSTQGRKDIYRISRQMSEAEMANFYNAAPTAVRCRNPSATNIDSFQSTGTNGWFRLNAF
jgi:hypothetical protein